MNQLQIDSMRLIRSQNVGPRTFISLVRLYGTPSKALEAITDMSVRGGRMRPIKLCTDAQVLREIELCTKKGAQIITYYDEQYPKLLKQIDDWPPVLTVFGQTEILNKPSIAIVGARNASANGCNFAGSIARELGLQGLVTSSGLARGIDTAAHKNSLEHGTIAVVAGGIDKIYPPENKDLFLKISQTGAVIAEMPFGEVPRAQNFPRRNRIISGIARGTIVIEASLNSGSLITARMALEQNREIFAVPGSPLDPRCAGTNKLIKQGAHILTNIDDILSVIDLNLQESYLSEGPVREFTNQDAPPIDEDDLNQARPIILEKISCSPTPINDIITQTGIATNIVICVLLELELAGRLNRHSGNMVSVNFVTSEII